MNSTQPWSDDQIKKAWNDLQTLPATIIKPQTIYPQPMFPYTPTQPQPLTWSMPLAPTSPLTAEEWHILLTLLAKLQKAAPSAPVPTPPADITLTSEISHDASHP